MANSISVRFAKALMDLYPNRPDLENMHNYEIFHHDDYLSGSETKKAEIRSLSSQSRYEYEKIETSSIYISLNLIKEGLKIKKFSKLAHILGGRSVTGLSDMVSQRVAV